jgi:arsenate reductase-like glutaredoxin family protein
LRRVAADIGGAKALVNPMKVDDPAYKANVANRDLSEKDLLEILHQYPDLLKKPILFDGTRAVVGFAPQQLERITAS